MTKLELLKEYHGRECHNLMCCSTNYLMTVPREGYEQDWEGFRERVTLLEELIRIEAAEDDAARRRARTSITVHVAVSSIELTPEQFCELREKLGPAIKAAYASGSMA